MSFTPPAIFFSFAITAGISWIFVYHIYLKIINSPIVASAEAIAIVHITLL